MKCEICGRACDPWEWNTDGTYTHSGCLRSMQPVAKGPKGGYLYNAPKGEE